MHVSIQVRPLVALDELLIFIWTPAWLAQPARAVTQVPAPRLSTEGGTYQRALVASGRYLPPPSVAARHEAMTIADQALTDAPLTQPCSLRDSLLHAPTSNTSFVAWSAWWRFLLHIKSTLQTGFSISGVLEKAAGPCTHTHNPPQLSRIPGNITPNSSRCCSGFEDQTARSVSRSTIMRPLVSLARRYTIRTRVLSIPRKQRC